ncbi:unnamed protein product [Leptidea sinapis]|uniref:Uncharacterized protein n=1 Tax=Leptidea sinapis TaxID=189913 RepID=A0A5E4QF33_9NEOP|nr:unnamed protein product [Leptidea sinapis]
MWLLPMSTNSDVVMSMVLRLSGKTLTCSQTTLEVQGSSSYTAPGGEVVSIQYVANEAPTFPPQSQSQTTSSELWSTSQPTHPSLSQPGPKFI